MADLLKNWTNGKVRTIYSLSEKYDSIVKTATTAARIDGILVDPTVRDTYHYTKCAEAP